MRHRSGDQAARRERYSAGALVFTETSAGRCRGYGHDDADPWALNVQEIARLTPDAKRLDLDAFARAVMALPRGAQSGQNLPDFSQIGEAKTQNVQ